MWCNHHCKIVMNGHYLHLQKILERRNTMIEIIPDTIALDIATSKKYVPVVRALELYLSFETEMKERLTDTEYRVLMNIIAEIADSQSL